MEEPIGVEGAVITPVSMGDLFGQKPEDIKEVLRVVEYCPEHVFAILTKLPQHALQYSPYPINVWFGVTVNSQADVWRLDVLRKIEAPRKYCLFEPLYGEISYSLDFLDLIVIGPQTKPTLQPRAEWVKSVLKNAPGVHVFMKSTLKVNIRNFGNELFNNV
jgi:protein gp37